MGLSIFLGWKVAYNIYMNNMEDVLKWYKKYTGTDYDPADFTHEANFILYMTEYAKDYHDSQPPEKLTDTLVNDWEFAKQLDQFKAKVLDPQTKRVDDAFKIMSDLNYPWKDEAQRKLGQTQMDNYRVLWENYKKFHEEGKKLVLQHEALVDALSKWYDTWYNNISNDGKQETEIMEMQADMLNEIFVEIYKALEPLKLEIKPPKALNF